MALNAKTTSSNNGPKAPALDPGAYPARVVQVISLGVQEQRPYEGQAKNPVNELFVTYEMLDEYLVGEDGEEDLTKPRWLSERFPFHNLSSDKAKSTKRYTALDPDMNHGGDWAVLTGAPCMVTVAQYESKGITRNKVSDVSTMRPKEAMKARELVNPPKVFDLDEPDMEIFFSLPDWLQEVIKGNLNYEGSVLEKLVKKGPKESDKKDEGKSAKADKSTEEKEEASDDEDW